MQVEGQHCSLLQMATGARVSNAYATYLLQEDSFRKRKLILHSTNESPGLLVKTPVVKDGHACH